MDSREWEALETPEPDDDVEGTLTFRCSEKNCAAHFIMGKEDAVPEKIRDQFKQRGWVHLESFNCCDRHALRFLAMEVRMLRHQMR